MKSLEDKDKKTVTVDGEEFLLEPERVQEEEIIKTETIDIEDTEQMWL